MNPSAADTGKTGSPTRFDRELGWVTLTAFIVFFTKLGEGSLDADPVVYASVAKHMAETGDWMSMQLGNEPYFNKPPLMFWLTALIFRVFGATTFTACVASAAFGAGACVAVYRLARDLFDRPTALLSAWVLLSTFDFLSFATRFRLESVCAFFLILSLHDTLRAVRSRAPAPLARAGIWIGLCFMAKGGPGFIALACVLAFLTWSRAASLLWSRAGLAGAVGLLALALFWPVSQWLEYGEPYLAQAIGSELIGRLGPDSPIDRSYVGVLLERYWPWLPFLVLGSWRLFARERPPVAVKLLGSWIVVSLAILSLTDIQYGRYLSVLWPAFAIVTGRWFAQVVRPAFVAALSRNLPWIAVAFGVAAVLLPFPLHTDRAESARRLHALIGALEPERNDVVSYREQHAFWRAQFHFYLDRELRVLTSREELDRHPARLVISRRSAGAELEAADWIPLLRGRRWTAYERPPSPGTTTRDPSSTLR